jgi:CDP-diacylglycerol--glycerol-3-phosphate 3-phosphatidyltransferase
VTVSGVGEQEYANSAGFPKWWRMREIRGISVGEGLAYCLPYSQRSGVLRAAREGIMKSLLTPNKVTALRMVLACVAVALYAAAAHAGLPQLGVIALALTVMCIALDGLDGYLARRLNLATPLGAQLDIVGDRVIENVFFTYFAVCGLISLWVPVIFFVRGSMTDLLRGLAVTRRPRAGRDADAFRRNWLLSNRWSRGIVASRVSRTAYAALKCICFCALGMEWMLWHTQHSTVQVQITPVSIVVNAIVIATVAFCLLRAIPVFWEGRQDFVAMTRPAAGQIPQGAAKVLRIASRRVAAAR